MECRQEQLLGLVVEQYINTAEPVGSEFLVTAGQLPLSGATVRNELRDLEEAGYLTHPHTSAGRIPTEEGYRYYVDHIMVPLALKKKTAQAVGRALADDSDDRSGLKAVGRLLAEEVGNVVIIAFSPRSVYYTGMTNLFAQAESRLLSFTLNISRVFDECEARLPALYEATDAETVRVLIGGHNPLSTLCGVVVSALPGERLLAVIGPMRMNYRYTRALVACVREML